MRLIYHNVVSLEGSSPAYSDLTIAMMRGVAATTYCYLCALADTNELTNVSKSTHVELGVRNLDTQNARCCMMMMMM